MYKILIIEFSFQEKSVKLDLGLWEVHRRVGGDTKGECYISLTIKLLQTKRFDTFLSLWKRKSGDVGIEDHVVDDSPPKNYLPTSPSV